MIDLPEERQKRWQPIVGQLEPECRSLSLSEKGQIANLLTAIARLQRSLDHLLGKAGGEHACAACEEACCVKGHNQVGHRPYHCITYLCDKLEEHLNELSRGSIGSTGSIENATRGLPTVMSVVG